MKKIILGPFTRANNSNCIEVVVENKQVVDVRCSAIFFRGFELMLQGKDPKDASYLTQRICGICSSAHAFAAALALEDAAGIKPPPNGNLLRNLIMGADFLQNHIRHFYLFSLIDYIDGPNLPPFIPGYTADKRLAKKVNEAMIKHVYLSIETGRLAHELVTLLGGKAPFSHGILAGGSTVPPAADIIMVFQSKLKAIREFIKKVMLPDVLTLAEVYADYYKIGCRKPDLLEYGAFPMSSEDRERYFPEGVVIDGQLQKFDPAVIQEHLDKSWYKADSRPQPPSWGETVPDPEKEGAYSWVKAPRYRGRALEGGPLARLWIRGDYRKGVSTMDRIVCRALEAEKIADLMADWLEELKPGEPVITSFKVPKESEGKGLTGAMRGPLGHWLRIEKGRISHYQVITPSAWNFSPQDNWGGKGPVEEALMGMTIADENQPIEVGRVVRAFDICSSCSAHVLIPGSPVKEINILA